MNEEDDIFNGLGIEVSLKERDDFLKIKETLTRIGVSSRKEKKLYQSCHILHKRGRYVILHFKELFELDGLKSDVSDEDIARRNTIVGLLEQWDLLDVLEEDDALEPKLSLAKMKIIPFKEKGEWELIPKYHIGKKK
ncbi:translational repressor RegA [Hyphomonas sp.]|uniref:translational repressor RegA n=1 Tax=Hyphomonas sp. TaxID=87 RepID=UPI000C8FAB6A|nr:translational repressor RegA [Hyphomonas sp.]MAL45463.1 translation repressor protein [Hyphomonas sp.]